MRFHFEDLARPKSAAKYLVALSSEVKLSQAQEAIARALGYRDWHELSAATPAVVSLPRPDIKDAIIVRRLSQELGLDPAAVQKAMAKSRMPDGAPWTEERHERCRVALGGEALRLSAVDIVRGRAATAYRLPPHHEHDDCIRIAYEWLDAQSKTKGVTRKTYALKHIIEEWGGRYVSQSDVEVAAQIHPLVRGVYPHFNISSGLTLPSQRRLEGIGEAGKHDNYSRRLRPELYKRIEE